MDRNFLRDRGRVEEAQEVIQLELFCVGLLLATGHIQDKGEQALSHLLDTLISCSNATCVKVDEVIPLLLHVITGTDLYHRGFSKAVGSAASCHEHLQRERTC